MRLPAILACLALSACASLSDHGAIRHRYVLIGEQGAATARVLTTSASCPDIDVDGRRVPMALRAAPASFVRPTNQKDPEVQREDFPIRVCEAPLPQSARAASVDGLPLPLPKAEPKRLVVIGDTGCRLSLADQVWQACNDPQAFPFATVAASIARWQPDLILHVGDYLYREHPCPADQAGCAGTPSGFGFAAWEADFFGPARPMLEAAPLVAARGNHENCRRGGIGYWRLLDPRPLQAGRDCTDPALDRQGDHGLPYVIPFGGSSQLVVLDTAANVSRGYKDAAWQIAAFAQDAATVEALSEQTEHTLVLQHHPPLSIAGELKNGKAIYFSGDRGMMQALQHWNPAMFPARVDALLSGHAHMWQMESFGGAYPAQFVSGFSGTDEDMMPMPDPLPAAAKPGAGAVLDAISAWVGGYGFMTMERTGPASWAINVYDRHGQSLNQCQLDGRLARCARARLP